MTTFMPSEMGTFENYSILKPDMALAMTSCWISDVPSKIVWLISDRPVRFEQGLDVRFRVHLVRAGVVDPGSCRDESRVELRNDLRRLKPAETWITVLQFQVLSTKLG